MAGAKGGLGRYPAERRITMILKLAALGAIGYAGYRYMEKNKGQSPSSNRQQSTGTDADVSDPQVALAGGPLSGEAALRHAGQPLSQ
jgi:uncharacterized membrane protein YebE (DUF533 family)